VAATAEDYRLREFPYMGYQPLHDAMARATVQRPGEAALRLVGKPMLYVNFTAPVPCCAEKPANAQT
jgi:hypothetical protein